MDTIRPEQLKAIDTPSNGQIPSYDSATEQFEWIHASGALGATSFLDLTDTPDSFTGQAGKSAVVNEAENALVFITISGGTGATALADLTDVDVAGVTDGQVLTYDDGTATWIPSSISGAIIDHAALNNLDYASAGHTGFEPTVTKGNLTVTSPLEVSATRQVIGGAAGISMPKATPLVSGYLASEDFNTFNNKPTTLAGLTDVNVSGVLDGQFLAYSSALSKWIPASGLSGGYVAAYFDEDSDHDYLHILTSMDGLDWTDLNITFPEEARDPTITFYNNKWWIAHTKHGTPYDEIPIYSSDDLETWTNVVDLDTSAMGNPGTYAWSPEWFIDSDNSVHLLIACGTGNKLIYETHPTNAAWTTWSNLVAITGTGFPAVMIDPFIVKTDSTYRLFYKDDDTDYICEATSTDLLSGYTEIHDGNWAGWGTNREGECFFRLSSGGWRIYFNTTLTNGQYYSDSTDLESWTAIDTVDDMVNLSHGTVYMTQSFANYLDLVRILNLGGVEEAPMDSNFYLRKDGGWDQLVITSSGTLSGHTLYAGTTISGVIVPAGGQANVDFTSIPSTYDELFIYIIGKTEKSADKYDKIYISLNNDTTNGNYERELLYGGQNTPSEQSATDRAVCSLPGNDGYIGAARIHIPHYTGSFRKMIHTMGGTNYGGVDTYVENYLVAWNNTAAITRITLTPVSATDFAAGTVVKLIGFKDTIVGGDGTGITTFLGLTDTPSSYTGQAGKGVAVNGAENALEFVILSGNGNVIGGGVADQVAFWNGATTISGSTNFTYDPVTSELINTGIISAQAAGKNGIILDPNSTNWLSGNYVVKLLAPITLTADRSVTFPNANLSFSAGGTLNLGGNTLTVANTGTAALKNVINVFTKDNTFKPDTGTLIFGIQDVDGLPAFTVNTYDRNVGIGDRVSADYRLDVEYDTTVYWLSNMIPVARFARNAGDYPSAGFGESILFTLGTYAFNDRTAGAIEFSWVNATDASRRARGRFTVYDTAEREAIRIEASGSQPMIAFLGADSVQRAAHISDPTGGSTVDTEARVAISGVLVILENLGFTATS